MPAERAVRAPGDPGEAEACRQLTASMAVLCSKVQAEAGMSIGAQLRASREARGLSIDAVAHTTRVQPRILAAIERDDVRAVPPRPFGRGFVKAYAREIGLDGDQTTRDYFAQFAPVAPTVQPEVQKQPPPRANGLPREWRLALASLAALAAIVIAVVASRPAAKAESAAGVANVVGTSGVASTSAPASAAKTTDAAPVAPPHHPRRDTSGCSRPRGATHHRPDGDESVVGHGGRRWASRAVQDRCSRLAGDNHREAGDRDSRRECRCTRVASQRTRARPDGTYRSDSRRDDHANERSDRQVN